MRYAHPTETNPETIAFLESKLGFIAFKRLTGPDLQCGPYTVEVKSCQEWYPTDHYSNGCRRCGRFKFKGWERSDYFLFVLRLQCGETKFKLLASDRRRLWVKCKRSIGWQTIFGRIKR